MQRQLRNFPELLFSRFATILCGMGHGLFHDLPADCTCLGEGPAPVSSIPRVGSMPELVTYQGPACGHVETVEKQPAKATAVADDFGYHAR
jgi:hypothetical protein